MKYRLIHIEGKMTRYNLCPPKIFKNKNKDGRITQPNSKTYKTTVIKQCDIDKGIEKWINWKRMKVGNRIT